MKNILGAFIAVLVLSLVALNVFFYLQQPRMIFFPLQELQQTPDDWGLTYEDVRLTSTNGNRIHGWFLPAKQARRVVLFFHGNGGNISHRGESLLIFHRLGLNVLIIDYQGYGNSEGSPGEQAFFDDGRAAFRYLTKERGFRKEDVVVFGRSMGGAVAAKTAADLQPGTVILESTFSSVADMASRVFPLLEKLVVHRYKFATSRHVKNIRCPVLVLHSREDEIIPFASGEKVYRAANNPKMFVEMVGDHNSGFLQTQPGYEQVLSQFLELSR